MRIQYFAWLGDMVGLTEEEVALPPEVTTVAKLVDWLSGRGPRFEDAFEFGEIIKVVVNQTYVQDDRSIKDDDEVIFIPPISGG